MSYTCGHCQAAVSGVVVNVSEEVDLYHFKMDEYEVREFKGWTRRWLLCPKCGKGSVQNDYVILPHPPSFPTIDGLPNNIHSLYDEARTSFDARAYTGCEMLCRKILMGAAVNNGAEENKSFEYYVDHLDTAGYVTPPMKKMATIIRKNGNKAAHDINMPDPKRAEHTLKFTRRILDSIYGTEHDLCKYGSSSK